MSMTVGERLNRLERKFDEIVEALKMQSDWNNKAGDIIQDLNCIIKTMDITLTDLTLDVYKDQFNGKGKTLSELD